MRTRLTILAGRCLVAGGFTMAVTGAALADDAEDEAPPTLSLEASYTGEIWGVADGGLEDGGAYIDALNLQFALDLDRAFGWANAQAFVFGTATNGNSINEKTGDIQGPSNLESGVEMVRLYEAWIDQTFAGGRASLRVGLYDLNTEFDAGEVRALFINASHGIGPDYAQSGLNGPSIWPVTSLGARFNWNFENGAYVRAAILDGVPGDLEHPKRTTIDFDRGDGALIAGEVGLTNAEGRIWSLGAWGYTEEFPDLVGPATHDDNFGFYLALEERLGSRTEGAPFDLAGSLRFGVANDDINPLESYFGATLVATGLLEARPNDQLGLALAIANTGDPFRFTVADAGGLPARQEVNIELTYYADVTDWLSVQPDLQWIVNPGADHTIEDVFVAGLRLQVKDTWTLID